MMKNKIFLFLLLGIFMISLSSAGLFDPGSEIIFHEDEKNSKYGYYEINDTDFWFFNNKPVKIIELIENEYSVFTAWNIKEYNIFRPTKLFDKTNYFDESQIKDRSNLISSETHLYREWEIKTRTISDISCITYETTVNQTQICSEWEDNSYEEEYKEWNDWKLYNFQTVQEGRYQTKTIVTRDRQGTGVIDWVDENEGWDLSEWATWWDSDWSAKKEVSNLNGSISALYYISKSDISSEDFDSVRFIDYATETTELDYDIAFENATHIGVRIDNIGANKVYMYYGNNLATDNSNASAVYFNPESGFYFDEDANDFNNINNGTVTGATLTTGYINNGYDFTGTSTNKNIILANPIGDTLQTFSFWINPSSIDGMIFSHESSEFGKISIGNTGGGTCANSKMCFGRFDGSWGNVQSTASTVVGSWEHWVIIIDGTNITMYKNGIFDNSQTISKSSITPTSSTIGNIAWGESSAGNFDGFIDEFYIFDRVLNLTEVQALANQTQPNYILGVEQKHVGVLTNLISPENNENILNNTVVFNFNSTPTQTNLTNATLYIWWNNGTLFNTNFTTLSGNESVNITFINTLTDGMYKWNAETCGEGVSCSFASSNNSFIVHVTPITINILEPNETIDYIRLGDNQTLSWKLSEEGENLTEHLTNCSYTYNSIITYLPLNTCIVTNTTSFEYVYGVDTLTFNTTDIFNLTSSQITTWEYTIVELNQTFEENITEGELDDFSLLLNVSDTSSLTDATFSYNGTNYTTTIVFSSGLYLISSLIVSPTVTEDTNFSFNFFFTVDDINYTTTSNEQLVINSLFDICGGLSNDTLLNMSLVDEETGTNILGTIEIVADIVSQSSGVSVETINNTFENVTHGAICFTPESLYPSYYLNAEIKYSSDRYVSELYYIQNSDMADYPRNLTLFDLNQSDSTEFVVTFQNDAFIFVEGAIIQLQRKYIGENVFKTVEAPITADGGKAIVHVDLNTNIYRASVVKDGELLKFFDEIVFSCENELAGECTQQLRGDVNPNNDVPIESITDFAYSVSVSDENNTITTLFTVPSGTPSSINVLLEQIDMFGNVTSCNTTVITSAGSITCDFSDTIEKSILQLTISKDGTQLAITNYVVDPELDMDSMNFFIVFLFLISLVGMAISSPEWMMIIGVMVFMISGTLLLLSGMSLSIGLGAMAWLIVAVIIIILKMAKQEDR